MILRRQHITVTFIPSSGNETKGIRDRTRERFPALQDN